MIDLTIERAAAPCEPGRYWGAMVAWGELVLQLKEQTPAADAPANERVSECALPVVPPEPGRGAFLPGMGGSPAV